VVEIISLYKINSTYINKNREYWCICFFLQVILRQIHTNKYLGGSGIFISENHSNSVSYNIKVSCSNHAIIYSMVQSPS